MLVDIKIELSNIVCENNKLAKDVVESWECHVTWKNAGERGTNRFSTFCSSLFITSVYINLFALNHPCLVSLLVPRDTTTRRWGGGGGPSGSRYRSRKSSWTP